MIGPDGRDGSADPGGGRADADGADPPEPGTAPRDPALPTPESVPPVERPDALEWAGWATLAVLTAAILMLALLRPTDPGSIVNEIRLAAGFDRYQAAMNEGERLYATAVAEFRVARPRDDPEGRTALYRMLSEASERFSLAREEAEDAHEDRRAQFGIAKTHYVWARELKREADRPWYRRDDTETLERALEVVDRALALPDLPPGSREELEELRTEIERAITPWPIL